MEIYVIEMYDKITETRTLIAAYEELKEAEEMLMRLEKEKYESTEFSMKSTTFFKKTTILT